jgi:hypothetical protein
MPFPKNDSVSRQLSAGERVLASRSRELQAKNLCSLDYKKLIQSLMEAVMEKTSFISTAKGQLVIGAGAVAAAAVIVFFVVSNKSTTDKDAPGALGTVVPAERYRAAQGDGGDVHVAGGKSMQSGPVDGADQAAAAADADKAANQAADQASDQLMRAGRASQAADKAANQAADQASNQLRRY